MTGYVRKDTTNNIADGNVINAADLDAEFDGVQDAFNASTGHKHDGTAGEGATINALGPTQDVTISATLLAPKTTNTVDIGSSALKFKDLFLAGNGSIGGTLAVTGVVTLTAQPILSSLTASRAVFTDGSKGLVSNAITGTGNVVMSASPTLTGTISAEALTTSSTVTLSGGTVNGVAYLNGSKVVTSGSALTFDGTNLETTGNTTLANNKAFQIKNTGGTAQQVLTLGNDNNVYLGQVTSPTAASLFLYGNQQVFAAGGSEQMRLTSTGLGIGTSSPTSKLDIVGVTQWQATAGTVLGKLTYSGGEPVILANTGLGLRFFTNNTQTAILDSSGNLGLGVTPSAFTFGKALQINGAAFSGDATTWRTRVTTNAYNDGNWRYLQNNYAQMYVQNSSSGDHSWYIAASGTAGNAITFTQAMTLDASGNLGIGTSSPAGKLDVGSVSGSVTSGDLIVTTGSTSASVIVGRQSSTGSDNTTFNVRNRIGTSVLYVDTGGQNVGIGTSSPSNKLSVSSSAGGNVASFTDTTSADLQINLTSGVSLLTPSTGILAFGTSSTERARIDSSGNLLVGTTSQTGKLAVNGDATSASLVTFYSSTAGDVGQAGLLIGKQDNNTTTSQVILRATILSTGAGAGQINMNGANTLAFGTYSDQRLKENIVDLPSQLSNILALHPVEFDYIESEGGGHQTGFIAQEMQAVYPDAVGEREDGMLTVSGWSKTEARLVKAIQEQQAIIESLKARLDAANL